MVFGWTFYEYTTDNWESEYFRSPTNASGFFESAQDDEVLINQIDLLFTNGMMGEDTRDIIRESIGWIPPTLNGAREKINVALYLTLISPDYLIKK